MYAIINTERGKRNPKRKEYIIMKNINEMNREEIEKAIADIENNPAYISARMQTICSALKRLSMKNNTTDCLTCTEQEPTKEQKKSMKKCSTTFLKLSRT